jgi:hypothetical protein
MVKNKKVGIKNDKDKLHIELIPPEAITAMARVLQNGAIKYGENNWANGIEYSREFAAAQRHLWAWWSREDMDESGYNHLWHALGAIAILVALDARNMKQFDNRPVNLQT